MDKLKYKIAKIISNGYYYKEEPTYEDLLEAIYNNSYRVLLKVPINTFILGIIQSFVIKDVEHANKVLNALKEVVQEALEISGIELNFTDEDFHNMKILENLSKWGGKYVISNIRKTYIPNWEKTEEEQSTKYKMYMSEYFEI